MKQQFSVGDFVLLSEMGAYAVVVEKLAWLNAFEERNGELTYEFRKNLEVGLIVPVVVFGYYGDLYYFDVDGSYIPVKDIQEIKMDLKKFHMIIMQNETSLKHLLEGMNGNINLFEAYLKGDIDRNLLYEDERKFLQLLEKVLPMSEVGK